MAAEFIRLEKKETHRPEAKESTVKTLKIIRSEYVGTYNPTKWHQVMNTRKMISNYVRRIRGATQEILYRIVLHRHCAAITKDDLIQQLTDLYQKEVINTYYRAYANIWLMQEFFQNTTSEEDTEQLDSEVKKSKTIFNHHTQALGHQFVFTQPLFRHTVPVPEKGILPG